MNRTFEAENGTKMHFALVFAKHCIHIRSGEFVVQSHTLIHLLRLLDISHTPIHWQLVMQFMPFANGVYWVNVIFSWLSQCLCYFELKPIHTCTHFLVVCICAYRKHTHIGFHDFKNKTFFFSYTLSHLVDCNLIKFSDIYRANGNFSRDFSTQVQHKCHKLHTFPIINSFESKKLIQNENYCE